MDHRFASDAELDKYVRSTSYATTASNAAIYVAVSFQPQTGVNGVWDYSIRGNASQSRGTTLMTDYDVINRLSIDYDLNAFSMLASKGHLLLQDFVEHWILETQTGRNLNLDRSITWQPMPTPPFIKDVFAESISTFIGLFYTIIYIWPVTRLIKGIVEEKQLRIREGMRMMGLPDSALFCSWLSTYALIFFITSLCITLITSSSVYAHSNKFYIFIFFFFFSLSTFTFCWLLSVFFSRAQVATTVAALAFLGLFFAYFAVSSGSSSKGAKAMACLASQVCFGLGAVVIQKLESANTGVIASSAGTEVDNWSYNATIGMFIADFFIYLLLALYFQQIVPSEWGTHQKPWFCCLPTFWCPKEIDTNKRAASAPAAPGSSNAEMGNLPHTTLQEHDPLVSPSAAAAAASGSGASSDRSKYFEPVADSVRQELGVSIRHLHKRFHTDGETEPFVAVKDMNLELYSGQILALLGRVFFNTATERENGASLCTSVVLCRLRTVSDGVLFDLSRVS